MDTKYFYRAPSPLKNICYYFDVEHKKDLSNGRGTKKHRDYFVCKIKV